MTREVLWINIVHTTGSSKVVCSWSLYIFNKSRASLSCCVMLRGAAWCCGRSCAAWWGHDAGEPR